MSLGIRIALIVCSIALFVFVLRNIRKSKMRIEDSLFWFVLSALIILLAAFPKIAYSCARLLGFQAPINFVFIAFIAILLIKCFTMSLHASQLETKLKELTQQLAISQSDRDCDKSKQDANEMSNGVGHPCSLDATSVEKRENDSATSRGA